MAQQLPGLTLSLHSSKVWSMFGLAFNEPYAGLSDQPEISERKKTKNISVVEVIYEKTSNMHHVSLFIN